jgi:hypothetical protein
MDILKVLRKEESKLLVVSNKVGAKLSQIRAAINAMSGNGHKSVAARVNKLRGKHLSKAHRDAIKAGWAKRRKAKAAS